MNKEPLISIIVPLYNAEKYLSRCIEALLNQTYENLEIILVNDGSKDNTLNICREWEQKDNRIVIVDKKNGGAADARNHGLDVCTGDYIGFVDGDDFFAEDMFEVLLQDCLSSDKEIACCNRINRYNDKDVKYTISENSEVLDTEQAVERMLVKNNFPLWDKLYKRNVFDGYRLQAGVTYEDEIPAIELVMRSNGVYFENRYLYTYVQNTDSMTHRKYEHTKLDYVDNMFKMADMVKAVYPGLSKQCDACCISAINNLLDELYEVRDGYSDDYRYVLDKLKLFKNSYRNNEFIPSSTKIKVFMNLHNLIGLSGVLSKVKRSLKHGV